MRLRPREGARKSEIKQFETDGNTDRVRDARGRSWLTIEWIEQIWNQVDLVEWRYAVSDRFSSVYADLAWCRAVITNLLPTSHSQWHEQKVANSLRMPMKFGAALEGEHLAEYVDQLRVDSRIAERERWRASRKAKPDQSVHAQIRASQQQLEAIALRRRVLIPPAPTANEQPPIDVVQAFLEVNSVAVIFDVRTSRFGTVILVAGGRKAGNFAGFTVKTLPLRGPRFVAGWSSGRQLISTISRLMPQNASKLVSDGLNGPILSLGNLTRISWSHA